MVRPLNSHPACLGVCLPREARPRIPPPPCLPNPTNQPTNQLEMTFVVREEMKRRRLWLSQRKEGKQAAKKSVLLSAVFGRGERASEWCIAFSAVSSALLSSSKRKTNAWPFFWPDGGFEMGCVPRDAAAFFLYSPFETLRVRYSEEIFSLYAFVQCCSPFYLTPQNKACPLIWIEYLDYRRRWRSIAHFPDAECLEEELQKLS